MAFSIAQICVYRHIRSSARNAGTVVALSTLIMVASIAIDAGAVVVDRVVANINGEIILLSELGDRVGLMKNLMRMRGVSAESILDKDILEDMIDEKLMAQYAKEKEIAIKDEEIDKAIDNIKAQNKIDDAALEGSLAKQGMTMAAYREQLRNQMLVQRISGMEVKAAAISDDEVRAYYDENKDVFVSAEKIRASHIILLGNRDKDPEYYANARKEMEEIKKQIDAGADFAVMAKKRSQDSSSQQGGDLGWFTRGKMIPEFEAVAFTSPIGKVVGPVETIFGVHLIKVTDKEKPTLLPFDEVKDNVRMRLEQKSFEEKRAVWIERLRADAYVKISY